MRLIAGSGVLAATRRSSTRSACATRRRPFSVCAPSRSPGRERSTPSCRCARCWTARRAAQGGVEAEPDDAVSGLPIEVNTATWAEISPPRGGWLAWAIATAAMFEGVAKAGIAEIMADAAPRGSWSGCCTGCAPEVWSRPIPGLEHIPAGAAFAASTPRLPRRRRPGQGVRDRPWTRLTTQRGHVLIRRRAWTLQP